MMRGDWDILMTDGGLLCRWVCIFVNLGRQPKKRRRQMRQTWIVVCARLEGNFEHVHRFLERIESFVRNE
jgi:hypothetical protein